MLEALRQPELAPAFPRCGILAFGRPDAARTGLSSVAMRGALADHPEALAGPSVAIVGARAATRPALRFAHDLAAAFAREDRIIVSGGALGVDGAAHEGALSEGGRTVVVLGTGVDVAYPARHAELFTRVLRHGALLSPFEDGALPKPSRFPRRNPLIAALGDVTIVVEANLRSGSLGTAAAARELGRPLWARPGSSGCDALIARGEAHAATSIDEVVRAILSGSAPTVAPPSTPLEHALLVGPARAEELSHRTLRPLDETLASLCELEAFGRVLRLEDGRYLALPGAADTKE
jgi:DNA processing protein